MSKVWKIWLDAGHGGSDPGAVGNGWKEKDMNLNVALACKEELERYGVLVGMTRTTDIYVDLSERARMANKWGADFFVSCHHNGGKGDRGEVIHSIFNGEGLTLAKNIREEYIKLGQTVCNTYSKSGTGNKDYYAVIRETNMHAVITEGCFVDNSEDMKLFDTVEEQEYEGRAIARGILKTLGVAQQPVKPPVATKVDVEYRVYIERRWLPWVKNLEDYAGVFGKPIKAVEMKLSCGDIEYRTSNLRQNYYPWVKNLEDYAGDKKTSIDRLQIFNLLRYRVHTKGGSWLPWVVGMDDYAGIVGREIDGVQIEVL